MVWRSENGHLQRGVSSGIFFSFVLGDCRATSLGRVWNGATLLEHTEQPKKEIGPDSTPRKVFDTIILVTLLQ